MHDDTVVATMSEQDALGPTGRVVQIYLSDLDEKWHKRIEDYPAIMERAMERINYIAELEARLAKAEAALEAAERIKGHLQSPRINASVLCDCGWKYSDLPLQIGPDVRADLSAFDRAREVMK